MARSPENTHFSMQAAKATAAEIMAAAAVVAAALSSHDIAEAVKLNMQLVGHEHSWTANRNTYAATVRPNPIQGQYSELEQQRNGIRMRGYIFLAESLA